MRNREEKESSEKKFFVIILFLSTSFIDSSGSPIIRGLRSGFRTRQQGQILYQAPKCLCVPLHRADFDLAGTSDLTIGGPKKGPNPVVMWGRPVI